MRSTIFLKDACPVALQCSWEFYKRRERASTHGSPAESWVSSFSQLRVDAAVVTADTWLITRLIWPLPHVCIQSFVSQRHAGGVIAWNSTAGAFVTDFSG